MTGSRSLYLCVHNWFTLFSVLSAALAACRAGSALARSSSVSCCCLVTLAWIAATWRNKTKTEKCVKSTTACSLNGLLQVWLISVLQTIQYMYCKLKKWHEMKLKICSHLMIQDFTSILLLHKRPDNLTLCSSASATALSWLSLSVCCPILSMRASMSVFLCHSSTSCTASLAFRSSTWARKTGRDRDLKRWKWQDRLEEYRM